jgi:hypothetical protein
MDRAGARHGEIVREQRLMAQLDYEEAREYVITSIRDSLNGTGGQWDWDDFISRPTGFPDLEAVQSFCAGLSSSHPHPVMYCSEEGLTFMRRKLEELEANGSSTKCGR